MDLAPFFAALLAGLVAVPVFRRLALRLGVVARPRSDRWNRKEVPYLGGVGIFAAFLAALLLTQPGALANHWGLLAGAGLMFLLGLVDDLRELNPPVKLVCQILIALLVVFAGYRTGFLGSDLLNTLLTVAWMVGITNALNLLDNMDGLAGGISLIAAGFMSFFFWRSGPDPDLPAISLALGGAVLAFLAYNFPPARIFMGDSGSLVLGFTLAALAIARKPQASNVFAVLGVPLLLFLLPILDTLFVTITRLMRGQSPARGGRDHTSHRLVAFGLSERQTVVVLYLVALLSGAMGALVESIDYTLSLVLIPFLLVSFSVLAAYLSRLKVVEGERRDSPFSSLIQFAYRRRLFEIVLDFFLAGIAYYLAFWVRSGFTLTDPGADRLVQALSLAIGSTIISFFLFGVYRGLWRFIGTADLMRLGGAVLGAAAITAASEWLLFSRETFQFGTIFLFAMFLFFGLAASRSSFRMLDELSQKQSTRSTGGEARVLIFGAGDQADLVLRWLSASTPQPCRVIGIMDDDPFTWGRRFHEIEVLGGLADLGRLVREQNIDGVIFAGEAEQQPVVAAASAAAGVWVKLLRVELIDMTGIE